MDITTKHLRTLALMLILVFGVSVYERGDEIVALAEGKVQSANVFNPIATFLGIGGNSNTSTSNSEYDSLQANDTFGGSDGADDYFNSTNDDFGGPSINTPAPVSAQNTDLSGSAQVQTNTTTEFTGSLGSREPLIACIPKVLDQGEEAIVSWLCRDGAYKAVGTGFNTNDEVLGLTRVIVSEDTTLSIECVNNLTDIENTTSTCELEVARPALAIIATPSRVERGSGTQISWKTKDTNKCLVSSDKHPTFERSGTEGDVASPGLFETTTFTLTCETITGSVETRELVVNLR